ncbi:MAG TPA: hypothetical protein VKT72_17360 [Candidatus Baltobacteraceae bacterium]|nr:hypothetical protein [Candidatus Baltobacteraceae bacterium]
MSKWLALTMIAALACVAPSVAANQTCPPLTVQSPGYMMQQVDVPCIIDQVNPQFGCLNCPGTTVYDSQNPNRAYCRRWTQTPTGEFYTTVPQHRVNGKCVPGYAIEPFAKRAPAQPVRVGSPVRVASPVTRAAAPAHSAPAPMHFAPPPMHFSAPVIHAAPPPSSGRPGRP